MLKGFDGKGIFDCVILHKLLWHGTVLNERQRDISPPDTAASSKRISKTNWEYGVDAQESLRIIDIFLDFWTFSDNIILISEKAGSSGFW